MLNAIPLKLQGPYPSRMQRSAMHLYTSTPLLCVLLMNAPNLLIHVYILQLRQSRCILALGIPVVARRRLLPPRCFFFRDGLPGYAVEEVGPLRREPLQVRCRIVVPEIGGCEARFRFGFLLFPARIE